MRLVSSLQLTDDDFILQLVCHVLCLIEVLIEWTGLHSSERHAVDCRELAVVSSLEGEEILPLVWLAVLYYVAFKVSHFYFDIDTLSRKYAIKRLFLCQIVAEERHSALFNFYVGGFN